jgi:chemotaxis methyl-accepting protein methylase
VSGEESVTPNAAQRSGLQLRLETFLWRINRPIWRNIPTRFKNSRLVRGYGAWLHSRVRERTSREMYLGTMFFRNRPALELLRRLIENKKAGSIVRVAVLGCSVGVEVYSILWTLRSARRDVNIVVEALDVSEDVLAVAERGVYGPDTSEFVHASIFERLSTSERHEMFDWEGDQARVKPWLRAGITWRLGDAADPELVATLGPQELVVASNFLCHMDPTNAERCLRNLASLVVPGGYLFVSGVDLDVRTRVALDLRWRPIVDLMVDVHDGDPSVRGDWPWRWWGLEPLDRRRPDWRIRYASVFQVGASTQEPEPPRGHVPSRVDGG